MARCFVTRTLPGDAVERLAREHDVEVWPDTMPPSRDEIARRLEDGVEGLLTLLTDAIDGDLLSRAPALRSIANYAVGSDNVDVDAATARGVPVGTTPDVLTETTADLTWALMLAAARRLAEGDAAVRSGGWRTWEPNGLLGRDVHGATLGLVGVGRIGGAVARRAEGFGMEVLRHGRSGGVALDELLERSDFVSLHCPLTEETRGLVGERALGRMRPTAVLVNTSRGPIVDTDALAGALHDGRIAAAALDVTDPEPLPADHPLLAAPNLLVVPHVGSATHATRAAMADMAVDNLLAALAGKRMPYCANPEVYG